MILSVKCPQSKEPYENLKLEEKDIPIYGRRIDPEMTTVCQHPEGDLLVTGKDKILRRYPYPDELLSLMDFRLKTAPNPPT